MGRQWGSGSSQEGKRETVGCGGRGPHRVELSPSMAVSISSSEASSSVRPLGDELLESEAATAHPGVQEKGLVAVKLSEGK